MKHVQFVLYINFHVPPSHRDQAGMIGLCTHSLTILKAVICFSPTILSLTWDWGIRGKGWHGGWSSPSAAVGRLHLATVLWHRLRRWQEPLTSTSGPSSVQEGVKHLDQVAAKAQAQGCSCIHAQCLPLSDGSSSLITYTCNRKGTQFYNLVQIMMVDQLCTWHWFPGL